MTVPDNFLHVYGQFIWHGDAVIRGTRGALGRLRDAIDTALASGEGRADVMATDGEGYSVVVVVSSTIAGVGQPEYFWLRTTDMALNEAKAWSVRNKLARGWNIVADDGEDTARPTDPRQQGMTLSEVPAIPHPKEA